MDRDEIAADGTLIYATLTCPQCGATARLDMPPSSCQSTYRCHDCGAQIRTPPGQCCVFCAFGDVPCPPVQLGGKSCCAPD